MDVSFVTGRDRSLFDSDIRANKEVIDDLVARSKFLVIGAAGTIGQATVGQIFKRNPKHLTVVDISENNLVELVRDLRSSVGYGTGIFETYALDCGSREFDALMRASDGFDYVLNLSALKHVRSESDPYTLMRMIQTNILNSVSTVRHATSLGAKKYFCVSTDKAANPVNMMGASKRIMEFFLTRESSSINVSMARFANVAFSDGSLLHGFNHRIQKGQPISAPMDVKRYFVSPEESGELCMLSTLMGESLDIFFPKLSSSLNLQRFSDIAIKFLETKGLEAFLCESEAEARARVGELSGTGRWPCYFFESDTTGEKDFEEFFTNDETISWDRFSAIGVIQNRPKFDAVALQNFERAIKAMLSCGSWEKQQLLDLFLELIPDFSHLETGKYLDNRM